MQTSELLAATHETGETWGDGTPRDYYLRKWRLLLEGRSSWAGFNWAAAFWGLEWCFWRRLYLAGVLLHAAGLCVAFLSVVVLALVARPAHAAHRVLMAASYTGVVSVRLAFGALANRLYLRHTTSAVEKARSREPDLVARLAWLRRKGGPSGWGLALGILLVFSVNLAFLMWRASAR